MRARDKLKRRFMPPRQLAGFGFGFVAEGAKLQQLRNALADHGIGQSEVAAKHQQVFFGGEVRVQRVHLRDHAQAGLDGQRVTRHLQTVEITDGTAIGLRQTQAHAQGGGFARTVGADHPQAFAGFDVERQVIDHGGVAVAFDQVIDRKQRGVHGWIVPVPRASGCPIKSVPSSEPPPAATTCPLPFLTAWRFCRST